MAKGRGTPQQKGKGGKKRKRPATYDVAGRVGELTSSFVRQALTLTSGELDYWVGQKGVLSRQVGDVLHAPFKPQTPAKPGIVIPGPRSMKLPALEEVVSLDHSRWLEVWQRVYWEITGIEPGFQNITLPNDLGGDWVIAMTPEVSLNTFWRGLRKKFTCWCYGGDDLESLLDWRREERSYRDGAYAARIRAREEADEEFATRSAESLAESDKQFITLPERVSLEGFYWLLSDGKHLDVRNYTLCAGSRDRGGGVPGVYWNAVFRRLYVYACGVGGARPGLRAREVVS